MNGKGDKPRPYLVDTETMSSNWARIYGDPPKPEIIWWQHQCEVSGCKLKLLVTEQCNFCSLNYEGSE